MQCESGGNPKADNGTCKGLFQIYAKYHQDKIQGRDIFNEDVNIEVAYKIWQEQGWRPWQCK